MALLFTLAFRNLVSHRVKSLIVGSIMLFGTILVVVGLALLDGMENAMRRSITESLAGDFQLYDAHAEEPLVLLGSSFISVPDVGRIDRFEEVDAALKDVDGVRSVVPMGFDIGTVSAPGQLERALDNLRAAERGPHGQEDPVSARYRARRAVRDLIRELADELENQQNISSEGDRIESQLQAILPARRQEFWDEFDARSDENLEFLDTQVAPLEDGGRQLIFRFLGTDLSLFKKSFQGFRMVKGSPVPDNTRGFLFSDKYYERQAKHRVARALDRIVEVSEEGLTIAEDPGQQSRVRRMARQWRRIAGQLQERSQVEAVTQALRSHLGDSESTLPELLKAFLTVNDANLEARRDLFYKAIAPHIDLYILDIGDTLTLRTYTRTGFLRAVNVRFFGTFAFKGLESSDLAGIYNLVDLVTFRELFGVMSPQQRAELDELRAQVGLSDLSQEEAEAALFGEDARVVEEVSQADSRIDDVEARRFAGARERGLSDGFDPQVLASGLVLNAAVVLEPDADPSQARRRIEFALRQASLDVQITDWQSAAGLIGQFIVVIRLVLYVAIAIIFLVALVIINNSMVMATMERVTEIGTLRAIGAHRRLVLAMFFLETLTLGLLAALGGIAIASALVGWWGYAGLPAPTRELRFLFGGPELYPELVPAHLLAGLAATLVVSVVSTAYPAVLGASIQPVEAMQTEE